MRKWDRESAFPESQNKNHKIPDGHTDLRNNRSKGKLRSHIPRCNLIECESSSLLFSKHDRGTFLHALSIPTDAIRTFRKALAHKKVASLRELRRRRRRRNTTQNEIVTCSGHALHACIASIRTSLNRTNTKLILDSDTTRSLAPRNPFRTIFAIYKKSSESRFLITGPSFLLPVKRDSDQIYHATW